ncbi:hypothetical protein K438DRAFT_1788489 [Mycena galopus ATCC 62051]|nr:hypothetical protein K438DRAFT_1788489 [Mycena galopus ATCC 62051]
MQLATAASTPLSENPATTRCRRYQSDPDATKPVPNPLRTRPALAGTELGISEVLVSARDVVTATRALVRPDDDVVEDVAVGQEGPVAADDDATAAHYPNTTGIEVGTMGTEPTIMSPIRRNSGTVEHPSIYKASLSHPSCHYRSTRTESLSSARMMPCSCDPPLHSWGPAGSGIGRGCACIFGRSEYTPFSLLPAPYSPTARGETIPGSGTRRRRAANVRKPLLVDSHVRMGPEAGSGLWATHAGVPNGTPACAEP